MALDQEKLNGFRIQREHLGGMLSEAAEVIHDLNMTSASDNLEKLSQKVNNDTFKIQVVGTFKNGKSTFINSLLGEAVLPAYALPCTAVINEVKYGETKEAILHFRSPLPEKLPASISPKALAHMQQHNMVNIPPLHVDYSELEDYVVIPMGEDPKEMLLESPYEKVELFWPLDMLKEGVEIIDSPGLEEDETRTRVTMNYLSKADAILFVLTSDKLCSRAEMTFIENNLQDSGFTDPFFIVNRFDLIPEEQKEGVMNFAKMKLAEFSSNEIFFVSAQQALDAEISKNSSLYEKSRMGALTQRLSEFLTNDKGKIKLSQPARELKRILNNEALYKIIPNQRAMLDKSLDEVKNRYEAAKPQLETLRIKKEQLISKLNLKIANSKSEFEYTTRRNYISLAEMIPGWIAGFHPQSKIGLIPTKKKVTAVVTEISEYISDKIQEQHADWKREILQPLIEEKARNIFDSTEQDLSEIYNGIDVINTSFSGHADIDPNPVPTWQRVVGAAGGLLLGDIGLAFSGGINGLSKELAKTAAFEIGAGAILYIFGILNPFTIVAVILAAIIHAGGAGADKAMQKTKDMVCQQIVDQISNTAEENSKQLAEAICAKLSTIANEIASAIDSEINQAEQQVKGIIAEMNKGKANVEARKQMLTSCEAKITELSTELDAFTFELIEQ